MANSKLYLQLEQRATGYTPSRPLRALRQHLIQQHGDAVAGLLFYGSCLRSGDDFDGLVDLYLLVDDYRRFFGTWWAALWNRLLPPNVYYLELPLDQPPTDGSWQSPAASPQRTLRAKMAVLSLEQLERGVSMRHFHSYFWGRFTQPVALVYHRDQAARERVLNALATAVVTFVRHTLPQLRARFHLNSLWQTGLAASYGCELRSEGPERPLQLFDSAPAYYRGLARAAFHALPAPPLPLPEEDHFEHHPTRADRLRSSAGWALRRAQGKLLSLLRLIKGLFTFQGGLDYILWKIERHSGVSVEVPPLARRHPLLFGWGTLWRLYRRGAFR